MKYDPEYCSYKLDNMDIKTIVDALRFYSLYSPMDDSKKYFVENLANHLEKSG